MKQSFEETILILDFGSQYTQLIARRVRGIGVYSEIYPFNVPTEKVQALNPKGLILSGGPASVYDKGAPLPDLEIFELGIPVLGICYGLQVLAYLMGGEVSRAARREYGHAELSILRDDDLFAGLSGKTPVWMSHGDLLTKPPEGFGVIARTDNSAVAAIRHPKKKFYGVQFHPEVVHTPKGEEILKNFAYLVCKCQGGWTARSFVQRAVAAIKNQVGRGRVICALSGGVDSSVVAMLVQRAIGDRLTCIFVDNGLLRKGEFKQVIQTFGDHFHLNLVAVDASQRFLQKLQGVVDPEEKRKIIGGEFISIFEEEARKLGRVDFLAQGTLYPDLIESTPFKGPSATIKSHHNVGGLPEKMGLTLIEPLKELFKDEAREVGRELGLPEEIIGRHPFPGPGLGVRVVGEVTEDQLNVLREADAIFTEELKKSGWYGKVWQALSLLLPVQSVGVMGDERTYENVIALRAVDSMDGMTADFSPLPHDLLSRISNRIINEVKGVNRVVYDISSKPPSTIEWE
ncbi:glutamine-hydrolyzing GMP synthase [candidate division KSB1 bacterium]|nr:glutamine-hydrolyzing GMP synthase [candidate division KSB1 bacterium]